MMIFLGSEITKSADFWPLFLFLNPEIGMISGPDHNGWVLALTSEIPVGEGNYRSKCFQKYEGPN